MDKDKSQTPIVVTAGQISRAVDRIIARWPMADTNRPDKQALLNDFATSVEPGKNWGSVLAKCTTAGQVAVVRNGSPARLRKAMADLKSLPVSAIAVGARVIEYANAQELVDLPPLLDINTADACVNLPGGGCVIGVCLRVIETQSRAQFEFDPILVVGDEGEVTTMNVDLHSAPSALLAALYRIIERASRLQWWSFLQAQGLSQAYLVFGPAHCIGLIPWDAFDFLAKGERIDRHHSNAVQLIANPHSDAANHRTDILQMAGMVARILPELAYYWTEGADGPFRLDLDVKGPIETTFGPPLPGLPTDLPSGGFLARISADSAWLAPESAEATLLPHYPDHGLAEALHFALRAIGLVDEEGIFLLVRVHQTKSDRNIVRTIAANWQVVVQQDGALRPWFLGDTEAHKKFRQNVEAWLKAESDMTVLPESSVPKGSFELIVPQSRHLNTRHWNRARVLFGIA